MSHEKPNTFTKLAEWCVANSIWTAFGGVMAILAGVVISIVNHHHVKNEDAKILMEIAWHFFVIIGEIVAVAFFLHHVIDAQVHKDYEDKFHKSLLNASQETINKVNHNIEDWKRGVKDKTDAIQKNLAEAILSGLEILPYDIVKKIKDANYKPNLIRKGYSLIYEFKKEENDFLSFKQTMQYSVHNIGSTEEEFKMRLSLSETPQAIYEFEKTSFKYSGKEDVILNHQEYPNAQNIRSLKSPLLLKPGENVTVYHQLLTKFLTRNNTIVSDLFSAAQYTLDVDIKMLNLPAGYTVSLYQTGTGERISLTEENGDKERLKAHVSFLLPGQGFFIELVNETKEIT